MVASTLVCIVVREVLPDRLMDYIGALPLEGDDRHALVAGIDAERADR
jgi:hypothetical protein